MVEWQTRRAKDAVPIGVRVRVPPMVPVTIKMNRNMLNVVKAKVMLQGENYEIVKVGCIGFAY